MAGVRSQQEAEQQERLAAGILGCIESPRVRLYGSRLWSLQRSRP